MFGYPLKPILEFYGFRYGFGIKPKYSYTIMYECKKLQLKYELPYMDYSNFLT